MIDILLVNPFSWTRDGRPPYLPYGILYLASWLEKHNVKVAICDENAGNDAIDIIKTQKPGYVGLSVLTGPVLRRAMQITEATRGKAITIWGGVHATLFPNQVKNEARPDYVVEGEGENPLADILGIKARFNCLDDNPIPAWDMIRMEHYIAKRFWARRILTLNTSRGCIWECSFCHNQSRPGTGYQYLSAENVMKQMGILKEQYSIDGVQFAEDCFDANKNRLIKICDKNKIRFAHSSSVPFANEDILHMEKLAGLAFIEYGVESGSQRILNMLNKKQTPDSIRKAYAMCKRLKIPTGAMFMIGLPGETKNDLRMTLNLMNEIDCDISVYSIFRPYPGTPIFDRESIKMKMPQTMNEMADYYAYGELSPDIDNHSCMSTSYLLKIQRKIWLKNAWKELKRRLRL